MKQNNPSMRRWLLGAAYLAVIALMLACSVLTGVKQNEDGTLQIDNGVIQAQDQNGDWVPVAGEATFELTGKLESTDPWTVAGKTLETNEMTQIDENLQVDDLVHVQGAVLEDGTWVAYSIQLVEEQTDSALILIGVATSTDPWVVNGITLNVTTDTDIQGDITTGMIVRVEILLLDDGTWQVLSIAPLGEPTESSGCATIIATVVSVTGDQVQFLGWPTTLTLGQVMPTETVAPNNTGGEEEDQDENDQGENENTNSGITAGESLTDGQVVMAVVCISDDGKFIIAQIVILNVENNGDNGSGDPSTGGEKVLVCHKPNKKGGHTLSISQSAVPAHLGHGDTLGPCP